MVKGMLGSTTSVWSRMKTITIRGDEWEADYILTMLRGMKKGAFQKKQWAPRDALVAKDGSRATIYTGQEYDPEKMTVRRKFWDHDHCLVCNWLLIDSQGDDHAVGWFNGYNWLCDECYRLVILENRLNE